MSEDLVLFVWWHHRKAFWYNQEGFPEDIKYTIRDTLALGSGQNEMWDCRIMKHKEKGTEKNSKKEE